MRTIALCAVLCLLSGAAYAVPALPHQADFLTIPECYQDHVSFYGTVFYPRVNAADRAACRDAVRARGYTHLYLSVSGQGHHYYDNPGGFRIFLQELLADGIAPVVFLTSNMGSWKDQPIANINSSLSSFIPQIDDLVSSYSLGIEIDLYWTESEAAQIGHHLQTLTGKLVSAHQLWGRWNYCDAWCDYMILQYGFGRDEAGIADMTEDAISDLGRPVVAGEYNLDGPESLSVQLGDAGVDAGAAGFGNGGTPLPEPGIAVGMLVGAVLLARVRRGAR